MPSGVSSMLPRRLLKTPGHGRTQLERSGSTLCMKRWVELLPCPRDRHCRRYRPSNAVDPIRSPSCRPACVRQDASRHAFRDATIFDRHMVLTALMHLLLWGLPEKRRQCRYCLTIAQCTTERLANILAPGVCREPSQHLAHSGTCALGTERRMHMGALANAPMDVSPKVIVKLIGCLGGAFGVASCPLGNPS